MASLFLRASNHFINNGYTQWVCEALNVNTINKWNLKKTLKYYDHQYDEWYLWYRFFILNQWFKANKNDDDLDFLGDLKRIIKALNLQGYLTSDEENYLHSLSSTNFTRMRNIKSLLIDFELLADEIAYFHYHNIHLKADWFNWQNINLYLTNKRIVVIYKNEYISFYLDYLTKINYFDKHFDIHYQNRVYHFFTDSANLMQISVDRVFKMIKKDNVINGRD